MSDPANGAAAGGHRLTVEAATGVLAQGGNAFDAAIAGLWMACLCEPVLASPGGAGFLIARNGGTGDTVLYDFFAQTPRVKRPTGELEFGEINADFGTALQAFNIGHGASATPGFVPGLHAVHADLATRPMADLIAPAAAAARDGIVMTAFQTFLADVVKPILVATESAAEIFAPSGAVHQPGTRFRNPQLGAFLDGLAEGGMDYYDQVAVPAMCAAQAARGHLTAEDFKAYRVERRPPLTVAAGSASVALNPPPSLGGAFVAIALDALGGNMAARADALVAALRRAEDLRIAHRGDVGAMLAAAGIAADAVPSGGAQQRGTTHISVIDGDGNAAAATISNGEGNGHICGEFGFMINNMLGEEDLCPGGFHCWHEDRRLASNMCPVVASDGHNGLIALGSGGSSRIRSAVFQTLVRMIGAERSVAEVLSAPRLHVEGDHLDFEAQFSDTEMSALRSAFPDHRAWTEPNLFFGGVHAVKRLSDGMFDAAGDPRRGGHHGVVG